MVLRRELQHRRRRLRAAFRYLTAFDAFSDFGLLDRAPRVAAWRSRLAQRPSVRDAVVADFDAKLLDFMRRRRSALGELASEAATQA